MNCPRVLLVIAAMLFAAVSAHAQAVSGQGTWETTLLGRDINLNAVAATDASAVYLYDTTLNVTWLRDANANVAGKVTAGANASVNGAMDWNTANNWATNLSTGSGVTAISGWRLPVMAANPNPSYSYDGTTAAGYNVAANSSEIASLFFGTLGNKSYLDTNGNPQTGYGLTNTASFQNLQSVNYWIGTVYAPYPDSAWGFSTVYGGQNGFSTLGQFAAMAVRAGDVGAVVASVPEPETYAMLLAGLGVLGAVVRRRQSDNALRDSA